MDLKRIIEVVTGANGAMIERTNVWENGIADMVATWISLVRIKFKPMLEVQLTHICMCVWGLWCSQ